MLPYFAYINLFTFMIFAIDKLAAKKNAPRVPENALFLLAFLGGSVGALLGMYTMHHKTKKKKFTIGIPLILVVEAIALFVIKNYL